MIYEYELCDQCRLRQGDPTAILITPFLCVTDRVVCASNRVNLSACIGQEKKLLQVVNENPQHTNPHYTFFFSCHIYCFCNLGLYYCCCTRIPCNSIFLWLLILYIVFMCSGGYSWKLGSAFYSIPDTCLLILWFANGKPCFNFQYYLVPQTLNFVRFMGHWSGVHDTKYLKGALIFLVLCIFVSKIAHNLS